MKKLIKLALLLSCVMCLAGCSKSGESITWDSGVLKVGKSELSNYVEYCGDTATAPYGDYVIDFFMCDLNMEECSHNYLGILPDNMATFKKKCKYYSTNENNINVMYQPKKKYMLESKVVVDGINTNIEALMMEMYNIGSQLELTADVSNIKVGKSIVLDVESSTFKVRPNEVIIPDLLRIRVDDGSKVASENIEVGKVSVGKFTGTNGYDYYFYDGYVIQILSNATITDYITFK